jgi:hypothetical protein
MEEVIFTLFVFLCNPYGGKSDAEVRKELKEIIAAITNENTIQRH